MDEFGRGLRPTCGASREASSADERITPTTGGDHQEYLGDWGKEADIVGHIVGQAATTPTIIIATC
jgi:hypothetical protein